MTPVAGPETIFQHITNGKKLKGIELAFARLTELVTG